MATAAVASPSPKLDTTALPIVLILWIGIVSFCETSRQREGERQRGRKAGREGKTVAVQCNAVWCGGRRAEGQAVRGLDPAVQQGLCKKEAKGKGGDLRPSSPSTRQLGCLLCGRGCCWEGGEREGAREGCDRPKCELLVFARLDAACHHTRHRTKKPFRCRPLKERWT